MRLRSLHFLLYPLSARTIVLPNAAGLSATWMPACAHGLELCLGSIPAARYHRARMTHAAARRGRGAGDEADHRLLDLVAGEELGGFGLAVAADLADHDDALGLRVGQEHLEHFDEVGALHRVAANADARALPEPGRGRLRHRLIGQRAAAADDADAAAAMDVAGHDADLAGFRGDHAGAVGPDQPRLAAGQRALDPHHVQHRDALGDADDERDLGIDRLEDGIGGKRRRHVDRARIGAGRLRRLRRRCRTPAGRGASCRPCRASRRP